METQKKRQPDDLSTDPMLEDEDTEYDEDEEDAAEDEDDEEDDEA